MVVKKAGKSVLDYDPLSWLKGDDADSEDNETSGQPAVKKAIGKKATSSKATAKKITGKSDSRVAEPVEDAPVDKVTADEVTSGNAEKSTATTSNEQEQVEVNETAANYFVLGTELTMKNVAEAKQQLDEIMQADTPVSIDADALRKIDSAGLQMLYCVQKSLKKNGASINWKQENEVIKTAAAIIAMDFEAVPDQKSIAEIEAEQGFGFF